MMACPIWGASGAAGDLVLRELLPGQSAFDAEFEPHPVSWTLGQAGESCERTCARLDDPPLTAAPTAAPTMMPTRSPTR